MQELINLSEIITGDRIINICDYVIITEEIFHFHRNITTFTNPQNIIVVKNFKDIDTKAETYLSRCFEIFSSQKKSTCIKLFVYTHILDDFINYMLDILDKRFEYIIYIHNSDHHFNNYHQRLLQSKHIAKVFSQNIDVSSLDSKLNFLPIGIANSMWEHGDISALYEVINKVATLNKSKNLYVNINSNTFYYRKTILDALNLSCNYNITIHSKSFKEYLHDLADHRFCLCVRGNGLDTHRFWESLYLGVIPVIINNCYTNMNNYLQYLERINIPFFEIKEDDINIITHKYSDGFFSEDLYNELISKTCSSIYNLDSLRISFYQ